MTEIAPISDYGCLQRGVSTMRLALGYEKGLPDNWSITTGGLDSEWTLVDELYAVLESFPRHHVRIICEDVQAKIWGLGRDEYHGLPRTNIFKYEDTHIFAFSYMHNRFGACHFLIGHPVDDMEPFICYVVSVSIEEKK